MNIHTEKSQLIIALKHNDDLLSRTSSTGKADQSVSQFKLPIRTTGEVLGNSINLNRERAVDFIHDSTKYFLADERSLFASILTLANLTLQGTLPAGLFREWDLPATRKFGEGLHSQSIAPDAILQKLTELCKSVTSTSHNSILDAAALAEWGIGIGPLHPFYDGCGRVSRHLSAMILTKNELPIKRHTDRPSYLKAGISGLDKFMDYYRNLENFPIIS